MRSRLVCTLCVGMLLAFVCNVEGQSGTFTVTGNLSTPRYYHTETVLTNGMVLVAGGDDNGVSLATAQLYNPSTGQFTATGNMTVNRNLEHRTRERHGDSLDERLSPYRRRVEWGCTY